jgi:glutamyl-tRNA synthetase
MEKELILKHALKNALDFGRANPKAVLGKVLAEDPELKKRVPEVIKAIDEVVQEISALGPDEIKERLKGYDFAPKKEKKKELLAPLTVKGDVVMRFAPNPSGPLHLGHTRAAVLNDEYVRKYNGKLILRMEDTDPSRVDPEAYDMIREDLEWLGVRIHETVFQSGRMDIYYDHARKLIEKGHAYVCTCQQEAFQRLRNKKTACPCRGNTPDANLELFEKMFTEFREGEAALRLKTDIEHPDPAVRDYPIMRISEVPHPRLEGTRVYPLMNFSVAVDDHLLGLTHVLRGKDHIANTRRQEYIYRYFGWEMPDFIHYGRMKIEGLALKTSKIREGIASGEYSDWDDARLGTLRAMRRRGIQPLAIRKAILDVGAKPSDISFSWKNLYAYNRDIIEKDAKRYFFVDSPRKLLIEDCPEVDHRAPYHPDRPEMGRRTVRLVPEDGTGRVFIASADFEKMKEGKFLRLMEAFNIEVLKKEGERATARFHSTGLEEARKRKAQLIHWVNPEGIKVKVVTPEGVLEGLGEANLKEVKVGDIIQFERFGFVRIDSVGEPMVAYFAHK